MKKHTAQAMCLVKYLIAELSITDIDIIVTVTCAFCPNPHIGKTFTVFVSV